MSEDKINEVARVDELIERGNKMVLQFQKGGMENQDILDIFVKFASEAEAKKEMLEKNIEGMIQERGLIISLFEKLGRWDYTKPNDVLFHIKELLLEFMKLKEEKK